jgi:sucrose-6-phosphate hydrolase SacC (GH32 family)
MRFSCDSSKLSVLIGNLFVTTQCIFLAVVEASPRVAQQEASKSENSFLLSNCRLVPPYLGSETLLNEISSSNSQSVKKDISRAKAKTSLQMSCLQSAPLLKDFLVSESTFAPSAFHYTPSRWINDPCGLWYNPLTHEYNINVQYNPDGYEWGNMHWLSLSTKDFVNFVEHGISMAPLGDKLDEENHVFTGMLVPRGIDNQPTVFYSSISFKEQVLFGWTKPYRRDLNKERVAMATSLDGGQTWSERAIIIPEAPTNYDPTGKPQI